MGMTEKQGGSDVRANTTRAVADAGRPARRGETYRLTGHKWFCSAPMSDAFLVLAQTDPAAPPASSCPASSTTARATPLRCNASRTSSATARTPRREVELDGTWGVRVGDEGRGVRTIIDMVAATRLDCILGSTATMRDALCAPCTTRGTAPPSGPCSSTSR